MSCSGSLRRWKICLHPNIEQLCQLGVEDHGVTDRATLTACDIYWRLITYTVGMPVIDLA